MENGIFRTSYSRLKVVSEPIEGIWSIKEQSGLTGSLISDISYLSNAYFDARYMHMHVSQILGARADYEASWTRPSLIICSSSSAEKQNRCSSTEVFKRRSTAVLVLIAVPKSTTSAGPASQVAAIAAIFYFTHHFDPSYDCDARLELERCDHFGD